MLDCISDNTLVEITLPYSIIKDTHGNKYIDVESYTYTFDVRTGAKYDLTNLYYGNEVARKYYFLIYNYTCFFNFENRINRSVLNI